MDTLFEDEYDRTKIVWTLPADLDVHRIGGGADGACAAGRYTRGGGGHLALGPETATGSADRGGEGRGGYTG